MIFEIEKKKKKERVASIEAVKILFLTSKNNRVQSFFFFLLNHRHPHPHLITFHYSIELDVVRKL